MYEAEANLGLVRGEGAATTVRTWGYTAQFSLVILGELHTSTALNSSRATALNTGLHKIK